VPCAYTFLVTSPVSLLSQLAVSTGAELVVGMAAGSLQGVPARKLGLDVVHRRTPSNVERLLSVL
jgi:hypothetical protein